MGVVDLYSVEGQNATVFKERTQGPFRKKREKQTSHIKGPNYLLNKNG